MSVNKGRGQDRKKTLKEVWPEMDKRYAERKRQAVVRILYWLHEF